MALFDRFKRKQAEVPAPRPAPKREEPLWDPLSEYSNMRVEVTGMNGQLLFVAKLMYPRGTTAELHQYSDAGFSPDPEAEPLHVHIRGYHDRDRKAIYMEGMITPKPRHIWQVEELSVTKVSNDRAFFRLETDLEATATTFGPRGGDRPCRLLNISVGGARVASEHRYYTGDKFLLNVKLLEDREPTIMFCQVLRVIEKEEGPLEYGCKFLELNEADQDKITENIFAAQRKTRSGSNGSTKGSPKK